MTARQDYKDPVVRANAQDVIYMLDLCHNIDPKLPAVIGTSIPDTLVAIGTPQP